MRWQSAPRICEFWRSLQFRRGDVPMIQQALDPPSSITGSCNLLNLGHAGRSSLDKWRDGAVGRHWRYSQAAVTAASRSRASHGPEDAAWNRGYLRMANQGMVFAVSSSATHSMSKANRDSARPIAGLGVEGDAHAGATVKHRSRVKRDPSEPNLRQVHLVHGELLDELAAVGFVLVPGQIGENVTTQGLDLPEAPQVPLEPV